MVDNRVTFGSKLGVILATVGCAVGLGSIWRFPYMLGTNGGAAFLLIYILFMIFLGIPVMVTEFFIGRYSRSNTVGSFKKMAPGTKWCWIGYNGILAAFLILGFYAVVSGWTLEYVWQTVNGSLYSTPGVDFTADFDNFSSNALRPIFWTAVFIGLTHFVIASGVEKGIERASKIMMPLLFLILVVMCIRSVTLPNAEAGLVYLFKPDFSKLTSSVVLSAVGQAFFSLSLGMGCLITYSSYFGKDTNMLATAWQVTIINTFVAILAGIMIFPAVFSFGIAPSAGAQLVFITLPNVFEQLPFSSLWSLIFYILLAMAALTSASFSSATVPPSAAALATQWCRWSSSSSSATDFSALSAAEICVRMSMQYSPFSVICRMPRTCPSMRFNRAMILFWSLAYPCCVAFISSSSLR